MNVQDTSHMVTAIKYLYIRKFNLCVIATDVNVYIHHRQSVGCPQILSVTVLCANSHLCVCACMRMKEKMASEHFLSVSMHVLTNKSFIAQMLSLLLSNLSARLFVLLLW